MSVRFFQRKLKDEMVSAVCECVCTFVNTYIFTAFMALTQSTPLWYEMELIFVHQQHYKHICACVEYGRWSDSIWLYTSFAPNQCEYTRQHIREPTNIGGPFIAQELGTLIEWFKPFLVCSTILISSLARHFGREKQVDLMVKIIQKKLKLLLLCLNTNNNLPVNLSSNKK